MAADSVATTECTSDDNPLRMLDFRHSAVAVVDGTSNVNAAESPQIEISGRARTINRPNQCMDPTAPPLEIFRLDAAPGIDGWVTPRSRNIAGSIEDQRQRYRRAILVKHLAECAAEAKQPVASAVHARHALETMLKAIKSARCGKVLEVTTF